MSPWLSLTASEHWAGLSRILVWNQVTSVEGGASRGGADKFLIKTHLVQVRGTRSLPDMLHV